MEHPTVRGLSGWVPLARGGFTLVWEARQALLSRPVAVKVYRQGLTEDVYETFAREAGAAGRLSDHPGVVTVYDAGLLPDARPYLIMELCAGGSLTQWLDPANSRTEEQIRGVGMRVADALAGLHARGVLHRDVKPANILIDAFGRPRLADFGLAVVLGRRSTGHRCAADHARLCAAGGVRGVRGHRVRGRLLPRRHAVRPVVGASASELESADDLPSMVEVAAAPITPLPGVNWFLMDALMAALDADSAARPSAAEFRDRLSAVPGPRLRKGSPPLADGHHVPRDVPERRVLAGQLASTGGPEAARTGSPPPRSRRCAARAARPTGTASDRHPGRGGGPGHAGRHEHGLADRGAASSGAPTAAIQNAGRGAPSRPPHRRAVPTATPSPRATTAPVRDAALGPDASVRAIQVLARTLEPSRSRPFPFEAPTAGEVIGSSRSSGG